MKSPREIAKCSSCPAPIAWVEMRSSGKGHPIDPGTRLHIVPCAPSEVPEGLGAWGVVSDRLGGRRRNGEIVRGRLVAVGTAGAVAAHQSHFNSCPAARAHRKPKLAPKPAASEVRQGALFAPLPENQSDPA